MRSWCSNEVEWDVNDGVVVTHGDLVFFGLDQFSDFLSCVLWSLVYVLSDLVSRHVRGTDKYFDLFWQAPRVNPPLHELIKWERKLSEDLIRQTLY